MPSYILTTRQVLYGDLGLGLYGMINRVYCLVERYRIEDTEEQTDYVI